jgi:GT2 family glycosyltransferase
VRSPALGRSNAKNAGIYHARGSLLLFCDDDIVPPPEFVETHLAHHRENNVGGVSLRHTEPGLPYLRTENICRVTWYGRMIDGYQSDVTTYIETLTGPNMSFSRNTQRNSGMFEGGLSGTSIFEEQDYSERLRKTTGRILFSNKICFPHLPQHDGNKSLREMDPAGYYRSFHHNEMIFFLKNRHRIFLLAVIPFCLLRSLKQARFYHRPLGDAWSMFAGVFDGMKSYYRDL